MPINSRNKGAKNERKIADLFTKWTGRKFAKTPASGGLQWKSSFSKGDIVCTKEGHYFPFCIEAKFHDKIDFSHLLIPSIKNIAILDFWKQASRDAKICNKIPLLFMRYNSMPSDFHFVAMDTDWFIKLSVWMDLDKYITNPVIMYGNPITKKGLFIIRSTDFFKLPYKDLKTNAKKFIKEKAKIKKGIKK